MRGAPAWPKCCAMIVSSARRGAPKVLVRRLCEHSRGRQAAVGVYGVRVRRSARCSGCCRLRSPCRSRRQTAEAETRVRRFASRGHTTGHVWFSAICGFCIGLVGHDLLHDVVGRSAGRALQWGKHMGSQRRAHKNTDTRAQRPGQQESSSPQPSQPARNALRASLKPRNHCRTFSR